MANPTSIKTPTGKTPLPVQYSPVRMEDLQTPEGVSAFNQQMQQIVNALNAGNGVSGPVVLPHGIDVNGATIRGVGTPKSPSDAISAGHAEGNYGAPTIGPKLDLGGSNALKGLTGLYAQVGQLKSSASGTITLAKLTSGGATGSITVKNGIITAFTNPT